MMKVVFLLKRRAGMTPQAFRDYYESSHVKLAHKYIGHLIADYRRNYPQVTTGVPTSEDGSPPVPIEPPYDVVTEMWFDDEAALEEVGRIFGEPATRAILVEDEKRFLDRDAVVMIVTEEVRDDPAILAGAREARLQNA